MTPELTNELVRAQRRIKELEEALEREQSKRRGDEGGRPREVTTETQEFALILLDRDGRIQGWSRGAEKIHGYASAEIIGQPAAVLYTEEERRNHQPEKELEQAQREGYFVTRHWLLRRKAKPFCAESVTVPMFDAAGNLAALSRLTYDVTGKPGVESELRSRLAEQTSVADLAMRALGAEPPAQWMQAACNLLRETIRVDLAGIFEPCPGNKQLLLRSGTGWPNGVVGTAAIDIGERSLPTLAFTSRQQVVVKDLGSDSRFAAGGLLRDSSVRSGISVVIPGDATPHGVLGAYSRSVRSFTDGDIRFVQSIADVLGKALDRRDAENALRQHAESLSQANAELQQFAYVASHDLQEPLRTVASFVQMLARRYDQKLDAEGKEYIAFAVEGVKRMSDLVHDLLLYSRVVSSPGKTVRETDMNGVLAWAMASLKTQIEGSHAVITHNPLPTVLADFMQMSQVMENLLGNAIKFRSAKPPRIHVSSSESDEHWQISVRDNGIGIEPAYFERIFGAFKRLHGREYPGSGIGLAICRSLIQRHNGRIWVESEPGKGSTFHFTIPK